jgi:hypothetical protein
MNIFVLNVQPFAAARDHCDKHLIKMIIEYGQMLSTAHRKLDGEPWQCVIDPHDNNGRFKVLNHLLLPGETVEPAFVSRGGGRPPRWEAIVHNAVCYKAAHINHPCSVWTRSTDANYYWLFQLFEGCLGEYTFRYGREHSAAKLREFLSRAPSKIPRGLQTPFVQAMPEEYKHADAVEAYRRFYIGSKSRFARWTNRELPKWFERAMEGQDVSVFSRTRSMD